MGTRQSGDAASPIFGGDVRLLDEVSQAVREVRRDPARQETCRQLEALARSYFEKEGHEIVLS